MLERLLVDSTFDRSCERFATNRKSCPVCLQLCENGETLALIGPGCAGMCFSQDLNVEQTPVMDVPLAEKAEGAAHGS